MRLWSFSVGVLLTAQRHRVKLAKFPIPRISNALFVR